MSTWTCGKPAKSFQRMRGISLLKVLLLIPVTLVLMLTLAVAFFEGRKAYWDYRVREMCTKDGGVRLFDYVTISRKEAGLLPHIGDLLGVTPEALAKQEEPVFSRITQSVLREGQPRVTRYEQVIIRRLDGRVVATAVTYARGGGDFPSFAFPSGFFCPEPNQLYTDIHRVFHIKESTK